MFAGSGEVSGMTPPPMFHGRYPTLNQQVIMAHPYLPEGEALRAFKGFVKISE